MTMAALEAKRSPRTSQHAGGRGSRRPRRLLAVRQHRPRGVRRRTTCRPRSLRTATRSDSGPTRRGARRTDRRREPRRGRGARRSSVGPHGGRSLAIVDDRGRFIGLVSPRQAVAVLLREHQRTCPPRRFSRANVPGSNRGRGAGSPPALAPSAVVALGLLGAMASAGIVAAFEEQLSRLVLLAFFIPAVVYMADAVGTQTEAPVIRGISVGVSGRDIVVRELDGARDRDPARSRVLPVRVLTCPGRCSRGWNRRARAARQHRNGDARGDGAPLRHQPARLIRRQGRTARDGDPGPALDPHLPRDRDGSRRLDPDRTSVVVRSTVQRGR